MGNMSHEEQAQADVLNYMQMEALGIKRRERITTTDFKENRNYISVDQLESKRKLLGGDYKPAKQNQTKISEWKDIHLTIHDDGTCDPGDLTSVNEGLGQTHRAKLMADDRVRTYSGQPNGHKKTHRGQSARKSSKAAKSALAPAGVIRGRVFKGKSSAPTAQYPGRSFSPARSLSHRPLRHPSSRTNPSPPLTEPQAWLASVQGVKKALPEAVKQPDLKPAPQISPLPTNKNANPASSSAPKATLVSTIDSKANANSKVPKAGLLSTHKGTKTIPKPSSKASPLSTYEDANASIAFLASLGVKFTEEQLRALSAQVGKDAPIIKGADDVNLSTPGHQEVSRPSVVQKENIAAVPKLIASNENVKASLQAREEIPTNVLKPKAVNNQKDPKPPAESHQPATTATDKSAANPQEEEIDLATPRSEVFRRQREMIIGSQVYKNRYSQVAGRLVDSFRKLSLADPDPVSTLTAQAQSTAQNEAVQQPAKSIPKVTAVAPAPVPTFFQAPAKSTPAFVTTVSKTPAPGPASASVSATPAPAPVPIVSEAPPAAAALRPRFIPDVPVSEPSARPPAALASRTTNPAPAVENPFGPSGRRRPAGPSLPPHLMGKVASSDPGAAARAQYGGK